MEVIKGPTFVSNNGTHGAVSLQRLGDTKATLKFND